jgi:hypothetical protein
MTDAEFEEQKAQVEAVCDWWRERMGLCWWEIAYEWHRGQLPSRGTVVDGTADRLQGAVADTYCRWQYMAGTIRFDLAALAQETDEGLAKIVVHEHCHLLVNEMRENDPDVSHEERVVTTLAKALMWVREAGQEEARTCVLDVIGGGE